jgi:hypothetical protein
MGGQNKYGTLYFIWCAAVGLTIGSLISTLIYLCVVDSSSGFMHFVAIYNILIIFVAIKQHEKYFRKNTNHDEKV